MYINSMQASVGFPEALQTDQVLLQLPIITNWSASGRQTGLQDKKPNSTTEKQLKEYCYKTEAVCCTFHKRTLDLALQRVTGVGFVSVAVPSLTCQMRWVILYVTGSAD